MLSQLWFTKKIYPIFLQQLKLATIGEKSIFHWDNQNEQLVITIVANQQLILLIKNKEMPLLIKKIDLPNKINLRSDIGISIKDLQADIKKLKHQGMMIDSQHIIEFINNNLKNTIKYYHLSREEVAQIYANIIVEHQEIFKNNPPGTVMEDKEMKNTWID